MAFLSVRQRDNSNERRLAIIKDTFEVIPDLNINITDLNRNNSGLKYKHFFSNGYGGLTFKCTVIIKRSKPYTFGSVELLHKWYIESTPLIVATDVIDIRHGKSATNKWDTDGLYIITKNPSRKQTSEDFTRWELEFTSYTPLNLAQYKNDNSEVLKALGKAKKDNSKKALDQKLNQCVLATLKFSKKPKNVDCVKIMQQFLKKKNLLINSNPDGWYNDLTRKAVKDYQKKYKLKATGKVDAKTFKHMCKG